MKIGFYKTFRYTPILNKESFCYAKKIIKDKIMFFFYQSCFLNFSKKGRNIVIVLSTIEHEITAIVFALKGERKKSR